MKKISEGIRVRVLQTGALLVKNILHGFSHAFETVFRILIPSFCVLFLFLVKHQLVSNTTKYHVAPKSVPDVPASSDGQRLLYSVELSWESAQMSGNQSADSPVYSVVDAMAKKLDVEKDPAAYFFDNYHNCTSGMCRIWNCDMLKVILALTNETTRGFSTAFCLMQTPIGIDYFIYRDEQTKFGNPWAVKYLPEQLTNDWSTAVQKAIVESILEVQSGERAELKVRIQTPHIKPIQLDAIPSFFGAPVFFVALFFVAMSTHFKMNEEKKNKLRGAMDNAGMHEGAYWCSWLLYQMIILTAAVFLMICMGWICRIHFFLRSDPLVLFIVFFVTGVALVANFMCFASCCSGTVITTLNTFTVMLVWVGLIFTFLDLRFVQTPNMIVDFLSIGDFIPNVFTSGALNYFPPFVAFLLTIPSEFGKIIWDILEKTHDMGLNDMNLEKRFFFRDMFNFTIHPQSTVKYLNWWDTAPFVSLLILIGVTIALIFLASYFDNILPREDYRPKPFYFICLPTYWNCGRRSDYLQVDAEFAEFNKEGFVLPSLDEDLLDEFRKTMNSVRDDRDCSIIPLKIIKMSKIYSKWYNRASATTALADMTMCVQKGECLVIVGSNGAGKTTLVNCLIGNISPSTGDALIYGNSISMNIAQARKMMGVCPQFDISWDDLTVVMHMYLFACLKGIHLKEQKREIDSILKKVGLTQKRNKIVSTLSGGQKRRLSLALSILGNPRIIFLDEPTSGMDPCVRRSMWDLITKLKEDRVVVLTTHSMEEAEIAIMANGRLRCVGDILHLKRRFGSGYRVDVTLKNETNSEEFKKSIVVELHGTDAVISEDGEIPGGIRIEKETATSLSFSIPHVVSQTAMKFLEHIEDLSGSHDIRSYKISHTTLEDVFMKTIHGSRSLLANLHRRQEEVMNCLRIILEGSEIGKVEIQANWTLKDVRDYVVQKFSIKRQFLFLVDGKAIFGNLEPELLAQKYLPKITIAYSEDSSELQLPSKIDVVPMVMENGSENGIDDEETIDSLRTEVKEMKVTIQKKDVRINELLKRIEELERISKAPPPEEGRSVEDDENSTESDVDLAVEEETDEIESTSEEEKEN